MTTNQPPLYAPFPKADWFQHEVEISAAMQRVLSGGQYILGPEVGAFEDEFAQFLDSTHVIATGSGTDAIELILRCLDLQGKAVVIPAFAPSAVASGVERAGAKVVLADVDPESLTLCPRALRRLLESPDGKSIKAALVVHLYGNPAHWSELEKVAHEHGIHLLEDAAQAHGGSWHGRALGTLGRMSAFSFYPTKNLGAIGDAGAMATADGALADLARQLRQYGWKTRYESDSPGINSRMDELQASILRVKLRTLNWQVMQRQKWAGKYDAALANNSRIQAPKTTAGGVHAYHQYVVRCAQRVELIAHLQSRGIATAVLYPSALHQQKAWQQCGEFSESECAANEVLALPLHPYLDELSIDHVCTALNDF